MSLLIGLTGGIGSGKSAVAAMLQRLGATVIDADAIAKELTAPGGAAVPSLRETFGTDAITADHALNRDWMRALVFQDATQRRVLEGILHPLITQEVKRRRATAHAQAHGGPVVLDIPLLIESGRWLSQVDLVLVVDCREQTQADRVMRRSGWPREQVLAVMAQQADRARRRAHADDLIFNDGISLAQLQEQVDVWWAHRIARSSPT